ncbi:MAG: hypothetical protein D6795_12325 [Deltaproteobacteria bacterium]|nr:MAG: hypothetical protein D6795_12325 [Deltaproteobacteria bacterium]
MTLRPLQARWGAHFYWGVLLLILAAAGGEHPAWAQEPAIFVKGMFSRTAKTNLAHGTGFLLAIEYVPRPRFSIGWVNQLHFAELGDSSGSAFPVTQWISTLNLRGYREFPLWERFRGGFQMGVGIGVRTPDDPDTATDRAIVGLIGPGFVIHLTDHFAITGTILSHFTTFEDDTFFMTFNPGIHVGW